MVPVRVGVVGVGHLGYHHARIYSSLPDVTLVGVVDTQPHRGRQVSEEFDAPSFDSVEALVAEGINAVSVVVPTSAHRDVALPLLESGVDLLVEKPIASDVPQAAEMVEAAARGGR